MLLLHESGKRSAAAKMRLLSLVAVAAVKPLEMGAQHQTILWFPMLAAVYRLSLELMPPTVDRRRNLMPVSVEVRVSLILLGQQESLVSLPAALYTSPTMLPLQLPPLQLLPALELEA